MARERHRGVAVGPAGRALLARLGADVLLEHLLVDRMAGKQAPAIDAKQLGIRDDLGCHRVDVHHGTVLVDEDHPGLARFQRIFGDQPAPLAFGQNQVGTHDPDQERRQLSQYRVPVGGEIRARLDGPDHQPYRVLLIETEPQRRGPVPARMPPVVDCQQARFGERQTFEHRRTDQIGELLL